MNKAIELGCSECEKPTIHCKGLCQACYSRAYRKTESGYEQMRRYNLTLGKAAQKKYREKNRFFKPPKAPKPPKKTYPSICKCGGVPLCKGLCSSCYQKQKYAAKHPTDQTKIDFLPIFKKVLEDVKNGGTIIHSLSVLKYSSRSFYNNMSPQQKHELHAYKIVGGAIDEDEDANPLY